MGVLVSVSWLAKKLMILFAIIAIILIIIISIVLEFSLMTVLIRVFAGSLIFSIIGGILGEIIYRNINSRNSQSAAAKSHNDRARTEETTNDAASTEARSNMQSEQRGEDIEPLEFEELNDEDTNVVNNIDGEQGAEIVRQMSQDN